jgi:hypothetical protein
VLPEDTEPSVERGALVTTEGGAEDDDISLIALNVLDVLDEERHVFAFLPPLALGAEDLAEFPIGFRALLEEVEDEVGLLAIEGDDTEARAGVTRWV